MAVYDINITAEDIKAAASHTPLSTKESLTRAIAELCIEPVEVKADDATPLPPLFRENRKLRMQFQMGLLASLLGRGYAQQTVRVRTEEGFDERPLACCMDEDEYQKWASSHVMNQLERLKKNKEAEVVNTVFDFLYDYKAMEVMLMGAIKDALEVRNDPFNRAMQYFGTSAIQSAMDSMVDGEFKRFMESRSENNA